MKPLLSIVIPTKDRYKYLKHLLLLIDSFNYSEIEVIVQDNTENNKEIQEFLDLKSFQYLKYYHNSKQLAVSKNCDLAIQNSSGEYVCMIGDDDGITRHIVDCVHWMSQNNVDVVVPSDITYHWPDFISSITGDISDTLFYKNFTKEVKITDPIMTLREIMEKGFINRGDLPLVYHGIVKREALDKIYLIGETYFPGPSPDIANGVALCFCINKYVRIDFPIIIGGASISHGGGIRKLKNKIADIEEIPFLPKNAKENWENNIPRVWTTETVWPESAIKALRYVGKEDLIDKINFEYLLATFIAFHFPLREMAIKLSKKKFKLFYYVANIALKRYFHGFKRLIMRKLFHISDGNIIIHNLNDIEQAQQFLLEIEPVFEIQDRLNESNR
jgi:glycosyltransferase involved in cell wall biosynthesis